MLNVTALSGFGGGGLHGYIGDPATGSTGRWRADDFDGTTWSDSSGNSEDLVIETAISRFTETLPDAGAEDDNFNGRFSVDFNGSTDVLKGTATSNFITNSAFDIFIVARADVLGSSDVDGGIRATFWNEQGYLGVGFGSTKIVGFNYDGSEDDAEIACNVNTLYGIEFQHSSGNIILDVTGGTQNSTSSGNTQSISHTVRIGGRGGGESAADSIFNGQIGEMIVYNTVLSSANRTLTQNYIAKSYGLTW